MSFDGSAEWSTRARAVDARAITRADIVAHPAGDCVYPRYFRKASGARLWDVDGNEFIDYLLGYGPVILGHAHPLVTEAAISEIRSGNCVAPLWSPRQVELTERLTEIIPGAEAALLMKTGSDATSAAVRLSRIFTGRDRVLRWGYNGWHDWSVEQAAGVPADVRRNTVYFDYDDLRALEVHLAEVPCACIVMMPFEFEQVKSEHLKAIRTMADRYGTLLVFDEMRSGFRISLGGAQEFFGVTADLATFSKAMGNGHAVSALTGRGEVLRCLERTKISSTFFAEPSSMAASLATISILRETNAIGSVWDQGAHLQDGLRKLLTESGLPGSVVGYPPMPFLRFELPDRVANERVKRAFFATTVSNGILFHPDHQWFLSAAHTAADIEWTIERCAVAFCAAVEAAA